MKYTIEDYISISSDSYMVLKKYYEENQDEYCEVNNFIKVLQIKKRQDFIYDYDRFFDGKFDWRKKLAFWLLKPYLKNYLRNCTADIKTSHHKYDDYDYDDYIADGEGWELGKGWYLLFDITADKSKNIEKVKKEIEEIEKKLK
jgi:hypothetical protein